jgi:hypothetical protein
VSGRGREALPLDDLLALVACDGMPVPDLQPGVVFGTPEREANTYAVLGMTDAGEVLFATEVSGAIPPRTRGLFCRSPTAGCTPCCGPATSSILPAMGATCARCTSKKLSLTGKTAASRLTCHMKAAAKGVAVDPACLRKARNTFTTGWARAEKSADCRAGTDDVSTIESKVDAFVTDVVSALLR